MTEPLLTLYGEIVVPYPYMEGRQPADVERLLQGYGLLPVLAQEKRWQMAAERQGYVLTFTFPLTLVPEEPHS